MKLTYKIPLLFVLAVSLIALAAGLFFRYYFIPRYFEGYPIVERMAEQQARDIGPLLQEAYPDEARMSEALATAAEGGSASLIRVGDDRDRLVFEQGGLGDNKIYFHARQTLIMKDAAAYEWTVDSPLTWQNFNVDGLRRLAYGSLFVCLLAAALLLALFYYLFVTKSLQRLQRLVEGISFRRPTLPRSLPSRRDEIGELYVGFSRMSARLGQAREEQIEMLTAISHDLKTPLTVIRVCNEKALTRPDADRAELDRIVQRKVMEMSGLLDDFFAMARSELEMNASPFTEVRIRPFYESIAREYENELEGFDYRLVWSHRLPDLTISMNEKMIRRVFANLISNAVRYRKDDGLVVKLNAVVRKKEALFTVEDNGTGVPAEELESIFRTFYRVEKSRQRERGGTGLGLAICRLIVEQHGGTIGAEASPEGGLRIAFTLPF